MSTTQIPADVFRFATILSVGEKYDYTTEDGKICVVSRSKNEAGDEFYSFAWQEA